MIPQFISKLFTTTVQPQKSANYIVVQLNDKILPGDKGNIYSYPLEVLLTEKKYGKISGGGTLKKEPGEIIFCDIEIKLSDDEIDENVLTDIINNLESCGAPKGSKLIIEKTNQEIPFGKKEGLAVYLDGENLEKDLYTKSDINFVLSEINRLTSTENIADRYWKGESSTGLYFYGHSFENMKNEISQFLNTYPVCKGATIAQIA